MTERFWLSLSKSVAIGSFTVFAVLMGLGVYTATVESSLADFIYDHERLGALLSDLLQIAGCLCIAALGVHFVIRMYIARR